MKSFIRRYRKSDLLRIIGAIIAIAFLALYLDPYISSRNSHPHKADQPSLNRDEISFEEQIQPILNRRCVVCHSCYDSPCQLKLSSLEGLLRGASKEKLYNPRRLVAIEPGRLFIDAKTPQEWRQKGFFSVLDHTDDRHLPLMQSMLELKQQHPQARSGKLADDFSLDLNREASCTTADSFAQYAEEHPLWGMPYGLPNLSSQEFQLLSRWLETGPSISTSQQAVVSVSDELIAWERFLNRSSNKQRLVSRYLYEHLFHAHIHFKGSPDRAFYRLVRSTTPPGQPIDEIATLRPYDDPGRRRFYYRLRAYTPTIVAKNHIVYEFSDARMQRFKTLFLQPDYSVESLPSYAEDITSNPFKVFAAIPPQARYKFLLDEARFFIEGFVKGPVCRGQIALNVIEDQFWVFFFDPDQPFFTTQPQFLDNMSDYLRIPSERKSHLNLLAIWTEYWQQQKQYMTSKQAYFEKMQTHSLQHAMSYIWNGNGRNPNAALTVFRHFDSATVDSGLIGQPPETAWIIDYPLFERIHYLLVAGFNVYGNVVHQLSTRIYMDFLRMEGEDHFLAFLPVGQRKKIRDSWYQGIRAEQEELFKAPMDWLNVETVIGFQSDDVQSEFYRYLRQRISEPVLRQGWNINYCGHRGCPVPAASGLQKRVDHLIQKISALSGSRLHQLPEVSFLRIVTEDPDRYFIYTILRNKAYKNILSLLSDERQRSLADIEQDTLTVIPWLEGSYPNFFFSVNAEDMDDFVKQISDGHSPRSFNRLIERYGVRRTHPDFWKVSDWFQDKYAIQRPLYSGLLDLSRYNNL